MRAVVSEQINPSLPGLAHRIRAVESEVPPRTTKIQTMNRQANGVRDTAFFKLKILGLHETKYALVG
jgi:hypothetical protein